MYEAINTTNECSETARLLFPTEWRIYMRATGQVLHTDVKRL